MTETKEVQRHPDSGELPRRWDPLAMLEEVQEEMARLWGENWPRAVGPFLLSFRRSANDRGPWIPRSDVIERNGQIVVQVELPGVKKEDVEIEISNGDLVIRGQTRTEHETKDHEYIRIERHVGSFYRRIPLPNDILADQVEAQMVDGVLEIRIPRPANDEKKTRKIRIA